MGQVRASVRHGGRLQLLFILLTLLAIAPNAVADGPPTAPVIQADGPALSFDFPGLQVGIAEYEEGPTGTTVFYFPDGVIGAVDVRGGAPGTVNATALMNAYEAEMIQAVVFSGGSWYGLSAATGVANGIKTLKAESGNEDFIAGVVAAIIYDVGGRRYSRVTPDDPLGRAALRSSKPGWFPLGSRGAGRFAMQGVYYARGGGTEAYAAWPHSGQGGAFRELGPTKVAVFTVVNALGTVVDRDGRIVRCRRNEALEDCGTISDRLASFGPIGGDAADGPTNNTTLTLVVTNQKLSFAALQRLAKQVHSSMSRAIQPFATARDGDVLYAVTTGDVENAELSPMDLGVIASELAWDAVLASVPELPPIPELLADGPSPQLLERYAGSYALPGGHTLEIRMDDGVLSATIEGKGRIYFDQDRAHALLPADGGRFLVDSSAKDVLRFDESDGEVTGLTLNPGPWAVRARRTP